MFRMWRFILLAVLAGVGSPALREPTRTAQAQDNKPTVMLVLDSSRSMWGQIDGVNKVVSARTVVRELAKLSQGKAQLGVVSFGHRQSSGCDDVELMLDPGDRKASEIIDAVGSIKPKGSAPIAEALVHAARVARYKEHAASLVLIADGLDNCNADPCATAAELKKTGKDLMIHAIGFDATRKDELTALRCLAENTGGTFVSATNEPELAEAARAALELALKPPMPQIASVAEPQQAMPKSDKLTTGTVDQQPVQAPDAPRRAQEAQAAAPPPITMKTPAQEGPGVAAAPGAVPVTLSARTVEGGAIIESGLIWWIYKNGKTKDGKYQLVDTYRDGTPTVSLAPGSYRIAAAYGKVHLIKDIDVEAGQAVQETFILNAGGLRLNAVALNGSPIPPNSVRYDIYADESESDQFGNRKLILRDAKPGLVLRLNAGAYHVVSTYGDANAIVRADVTVEPGRLTDATINHSGSKVTFKLVTQPGGEALADTQWNILTPGGDTVKKSAGALPTHILASGNYSVVARHQGKNYTRDFIIEPGETKQVEVVIQ
jgi:Mg-chelatase subunit ChlD